MRIDRGALRRSPALAAAVVFGLSGAGFVLANLVLARAMEPADYATVALVVALIQIAMPIGPLGLDTLVARRGIDASPALARRAIATSSATGSAAAIVGAALYRLEPPLLALIVVASMAGGANLVASSVHQGARRFVPALALSQSQNAFLAAGAAVAFFSAGARPWLPCAVYTAGFVLTASIGWRALLRGHAAAEPVSVRVTELMSLAGLTAVTLVLIQIERLVIPRRLGLEELALFGVLAAVAASPYRVLQQGVGYTLLPRLRAASTPAERRKFVLREVEVGLGATLVASALIGWLAPRLVAWWLHGKYSLTSGLVAAAIAAGFAKILSAFATSAATALCTEAELARLRARAWTALGAAFVACIVGARWGVTGVVTGAGLGWCGLALAAGGLARSHLRRG